MDLNLFFRVIRRFKFLVVFGFLVATVLAILSFAKVSSSGLTYRQPKQYSSTQQLYVGFAHGQPPAAFLSTVNLPATAQLYSSFAASNAVTAIMKRYGKPQGTLAAQVEVNADGSASQIVDLSGISTSPSGARRTVRVGTAALEQYVALYQETQAIPRVLQTALNPLGGPTAPKVIKSPSKTRPAFVFLAVLMAFVGLAFILENVRPVAQVQAPPRDGDRDEDGTMRKVSEPALRVSDRSG